MTQIPFSPDLLKQDAPAWMQKAQAEAWQALQQTQTAKLTPPNLPSPHARQVEFIDSPAKRKVIRAGRRGGKTVGIAIKAVRDFGAGRRILYATPTQEQIDSFWWTVTTALRADIESGRIYKNETKHILEIPGTKNRIRAKTAWNADTLRGDYADVLILDEFQLMAEDTWDKVGAPMLLDNDGDAVFIYTPPSLHTTSITKAKDPMHAAKLFKRAVADKSGRWQAFHFTSRDNPFISARAIQELAHDMSALAIRQEIDAEDEDEAPGALWTRQDKQDKNGKVLYGIDSRRVTAHPTLFRVVVAIDPSATRNGDEAGVIVAGVGMCDCQGKPEKHGFVLADYSIQGTPETWARESVTAFNIHQADALIAEDNNGGEMVETVIRTVPNAPYVTRVHASRGKATRAEPISAVYQQGKVHHVGVFEKLESEMTQWTPGDDSPNRMDALVWAMTELNVGELLPLFIDDDAEYAASLRDEEL